MTEKEREQKAAETGKTLLVSVSGLAASFLGPEAAMQNHERLAIEGPLNRLLERLEPAALETLSTMTDPLALLIAASSWLGRVVEIARKRAATQEQAQPAAEVKPEQPAAKQGPAPKSIEDAMPVQGDGRIEKRGLHKGELVAAVPGLEI